MESARRKHRVQCIAHWPLHLPFTKVALSLSYIYWMLIQYGKHGSYDCVLPVVFIDCIGFYNRFDSFLLLFTRSYRALFEFRGSDKVLVCLFVGLTIFAS